MRSVRMLLFVFLIPAILLAPAIAQQIRFIPTFGTGSAATDQLQLNGSQIASYNSGIVLRLTNPDGMPPFPSATSAYFKVPQPVTQGFTTYFSFQMHQPTQCCSPGDGFAFILQDATATDPTQGASGAGLTAVGSAMGGMGYSGINNSLAVEFDILDNGWDPNTNHIAIQTCGGDPSKFNSPVHEPGTYTIGNNHDVTSCLLSQSAINIHLASLLGPICTPASCTDGQVHHVVIEYVPPSGQQTGSLLVYLDPVLQPGTFTPINGAPTVLNVPYNLQYSSSNPLGLTPANTAQLFVGFTGSVENGGTTIDILNWEFTPQAPTQVTQIIPPGGTEADYTFGAHQLGVTYPSGFLNPNQITMTVLATPVNQQTFYNNRLLGTPFADETCIVYLGTGDNNCVDYSVTCDQNGNPVTCPQEVNDDIAICSQFYTSEPEVPLDTDFLEAEPIGSNNWCSIWTGFQNNQQDGVVTGKGTGFSDIVATLSPTGPGMQCNGGGRSLKNLTTKMQQMTNPQARPPQGGFCPAIQ
jgi:hypothetical protein